MSNKRKICIVTGTRAEYGLLYWLMKEIEISDDVELQIIVTCMHLSPEFGLTHKQIEADGFNISWKVEMLLSSDTAVGICKSVGLAMIGFADAYEFLRPDIIVLLGDRYELLAAASAALISRIPIAHIHGGERTEGAFDESIRHSITKMSHLHFTSTEIYRKRVIQLGEQPQNVFNVGAMAIDNINKLKLLSRQEFEKSIDFKLSDINLLITFHPVTLENKTSQHQFEELLFVLSEYENINYIFTKPNSDTDGRIIINKIDEFVKKHPDKAIAFISLGQLRYLSALQYVDGVVGNSSSGLIEVPSFKTGTINIGDRQKGRICAASVINCKPEATSIKQAIDKMLSSDFRLILDSMKNPYDTGGGAAEKIVDVLEHVSFNNILKKSFYDIGYTK
ncbi:UDP-N,N'-diacetylbacillosamine 2-epimerase (hydrolyzing) [hydrothermal vent metagenome]|uniref:UDP-N,N'-diacetylbacillosamine 2-epimerase (Hydrolyzing) n=1 Tax=hydrothermal vent metagenome TaxID=652676 RepID=A0A3B0XRS7_9ZZZZ